jgi:hypothetical protein
LKKEFYWKGKMPEESQYKPEQGKINPLIDDLLSRAFNDQKEQKKDDKSKKDDLAQKDSEDQD